MGLGRGYNLGYTTDCFFFQNSKKWQIPQQLGALQKLHLNSGISYCCNFNCRLIKETEMASIPLLIFRIHSQYFLNLSSAQFCRNRTKLAILHIIAHNHHVFVIFHYSHTWGLFSLNDSGFETFQPGSLESQCNFLLD